MADTYKHPGVYIQEIQTNSAIEGVSTDIAAFIGIGPSTIIPYNTPTLITSWNEYVQNFGSFGWNSYLPYAVYSFFYEGGLQCYVTLAKPNNQVPPATASVSPATITPSAAGDWCKDLKIEIANYSAPSSTTSPIFVLNVLLPVQSTDPTATSSKILMAFVQNNNLPKKTVDSIDYYVLETFGGFTQSDLQKGADSNSLSGIEQAINGNSLFITISVPPGTGPTRPSNMSASFSGAEAITYDFQSAINSLDIITDFSIIAIPDSVTYTATQGQDNPVDQLILMHQLLNKLEEREDAFAVFDPPFNLDVQDIQDFREASGNFAGNNALNSSYGALYYPWLWIANPSDGRKIPVPPSGSVLGRYAAIDNKIGVYKAPAGINDGLLNIAVSLEQTITPNQQDVLNPIGINVIKNFTKYGITIWGARTLSTTIDLRYVNVRRLLIFIERSIYEGIQWVVFEPNDQKLWGAIIRNITAFLTTIWKEGALFGSSAQEAFSVVCDASNNPPETRILGELFIDVAVAPVRPAEFVILRIQQKLQSSPSS